MAGLGTSIGEEPVKHRAEDDNAGADENDDIDVQGEIGSHGLNSLD